MTLALWSTPAYSGMQQNAGNMIVALLTCICLNCYKCTEFRQFGFRSGNLPDVGCMWYMVASYVYYYATFWAVRLYGSAAGTEQGLAGQASADTLSCLAHLQCTTHLAC